MTAATAAPRDVLDGRMLFVNEAVKSATIFSVEDLDAGVGMDDFRKVVPKLLEERPVQVIDARTAPGGLAAYKFDTHGFQALKAPPPVADWADMAATKRDYYPKIAELVKEATGAPFAFPFNYVPRPYPHQDGNEKSEFTGVNFAYVAYPHSDFSPVGSPAEIRQRLVDKFGFSPADAEAAEVAVVNFWHPRDRPAYKNPLCLLDATSVDWSNLDELLLPVTHDFIYMTAGIADPKERRNPRNIRYEEMFSKKASREALTVAPIYNPQYRWVYMSDQQPEEAWIFKQFDTRPGVAQMCFHTSFRDPFHENDPSIPTRRSAEFRLILAWPNSAVSKL